MSRLPAIWWMEEKNQRAAICSQSPVFWGKFCKISNMTKGVDYDKRVSIHQFFSLSFQIVRLNMLESNFFTVLLNIFLNFEIPITREGG